MRRRLVLKHRGQNKGATIQATGTKTVDPDGQSCALGGQSLGSWEYQCAPEERLPGLLEVEVASELFVEVALITRIGTRNTRISKLQSPQAFAREGIIESYNWLFYRKYSSSLVSWKRQRYEKIEMCVNVVSVRYHSCFPA